MVASSAEMRKNGREPEIIWILKIINHFIVNMLIMRYLLDVQRECRVRVRLFQQVKQLSKKSYSQGKPDSLGARAGVR